WTLLQHRRPRQPAGSGKATVAVARKMGVVMHAMWRDGAVYVGDSTAREADVAARAAVKSRKLLGAHA
ncbi:MAG: hypothetical protein FJX16_02050, partial [Alphaproteobacteria bacterium]|nr:hypothetical protein [Alphaproteobacteria bacterium]